MQVELGDRVFTLSFHVHHIVVKSSFWVYIAPSCSASYLAHKTLRMYMSPLRLSTCLPAAKVLVRPHPMESSWKQMEECFPFNSDSFED